VSRKHRQPLAGNNYYAQKFLELKAKGVLLANDLQQQLANTDNKEVQGSADEITAGCGQLRQSVHSSDAIHDSKETA